MRGKGMRRELGSLHENNMIAEGLQNIVHIRYQHLAMSRRRESI